MSEKRKIRLKIWRVKNVVSVQLLENSPDWKPTDNVCTHPDTLFIYYHKIVLPITDDYTPDSEEFDTEEEAQEFLEEVVGWLDEVFGKQPKEGDEVLIRDRDHQAWEPRRFLHDVGEKYQNRYVVQGKGKCYSSLAICYCQMKPASGYDPETQIYEGVYDA